MYKILVVDDDRTILSTVEKILSAGGFDVDIYSSAENALDAFMNKEYDLIISDYFMLEKT